MVDLYNFGGVERNFDRFLNLYNMKQQRKQQDRGFDLQERKIGLAERSEGIDSAHKQMLIDRETEEIKMKQELRNDPAIRISIMSKALREAYTTGGKNLAENALRSFQNNPKYKDDVANYTIDDFQFTKGGGIYAPIITTEGERLEGQYGFIDPTGEMHQIDMNKYRAKDKPLSAKEYEYSKILPEGEKPEYEKFATSGRSGDVISKSQTATIAHNIRTELRQNPYVKDFQDVDQKYNVMLKALESSKSTNTFIAVDQALITLFNKMTDPQSVVRESEYARTPENMSLLNRIKGKAQKIMEGGAGLTAGERQALTDMASQFYDVYRTNYDNTITDYTDLAKNTGIPPELIGIPYKRKETIETKPSTAEEYLKKFQ